MANRTRFAGFINANDYNYGGSGVGAPPALHVQQTNPSIVGAATLTLDYGGVTATDGTYFSPLNVNAPVTVGVGSNAETVTLTAVSNPTPTIYTSATITATFANVHGTGDAVVSATFGLQEAINYAVRVGSGTVVIDQTWYSVGGTVAIIQACVLPTNGEVRIFDQASLQYWANRSQSLSVVSAPSIPLITQVASLVGVGGTWTSATTYVKFVGVTANGGLTLPSSEYSFTATVNLAIGGSGPVAATGMVGYLVYIGTTTNTDYLVTPSAASGTVIQCGSIPCFKIGTPFVSTTITTSATATVPVLSSAFTTVQPAPFASPSMVQPFQTSFGPFASTGLITSGLTTEAARVDLPAGFLNQVGRTIRVKAQFIFTPVSTAQIIPSLFLYSLYAATKITLWTVTPLATTGTTASCGFIEVDMVTAATGATGTLEAHGIMTSSLTTGTAPVMAVNADAIQVVSSTVDLTKQDTLTLAFTYGTANITIQVRQFTVEVLV